MRHTSAATPRIKSAATTRRLFLVCWLIAGSISVAHFTSSIQAQEASASPSATTAKLKERIERIVEEKREQIKGVLSEFDTKKRGTIGEVLRVSEETVTMRTTKATEIIPISDTLTILKGTKPAKITDIAVGDWLVVMGIIENDTFQPKRILVSTESLRPPTRFVLLGTIQTVSRTSLTLLPRSEANTAATISLTTKTIYQDINGTEIEKTDVTADTQALLVGTENDKGKTATVVRILTVVEKE